MADANSEPLHDVQFNSEIKCEKCKKKVKNGYQCNGCEANFHVKCGNLSDDNKWCCLSCGDKSAPTDLVEIKCQELQRANLLLMGENAAYKKMLYDFEEKFLLLVGKINNLEEKVEKRQNSADTNQLITYSDKVVNAQSNSKSTEQVAEPVLRDTTTKNETASQTTLNKSIVQEQNKINYPKVDDTLPTTADNAAKQNIQIIDNDGYQLPRKRRFVKKSFIGENVSVSLTARPKKGWLHVSRLIESTTEDQVTGFMKKTFPTTDFDCSRLSTKGSSASFKVGYPMSIHAQINTATFWPKGVEIRRFNFFPKRQDLKSVP